MNTLAPTNLEELVEAVRSTPRLLARGGGTKPALSQAENYCPLDTRALSGIIKYLPDEYTISVNAGTPLAEIEAALAGLDDDEANKGLMGTEHETGEDLSEYEARIEAAIDRIAEQDLDVVRPVRCRDINRQQDPVDRVDDSVRSNNVRGNQ